ncbi:hypothetical protein AAGG74_14975 [Bacillus mexicanus]|uniref:hypothetical protein n=1 Tax=Bacillus mexicanus TaxID=2834415 RepID=UPI003D1F3095
MVKIKNTQIKTVYRRWESIYNNPEIEMSKRMKAYSIMQNIGALAEVYEKGTELDNDDIDDLFLAWGEGMWPLLPEQRGSLLKKLKEQKCLNVEGKNDKGVKENN